MLPCSAGEALLAIGANQQRFMSGAVAYLVVRDGTAFWGYGVHIPGTPAVGQICDGALGVGAKILRQPAALIARRNSSSSPDRPPAATQRFIVKSSLLRARPVRRAEQHAAALPRRDRSLPLPVECADPVLRKGAELLVENYWARICPGFVERVVRALRSRVVSGNASLEAVAESLALTPRTLNRRLSAEGRTFRQLSNEARSIVAQQLLAGTQMPVTSVALALGYADASAFTRAFQRSAGWRPANGARGCGPTRGNEPS